ncbi:hypothetical protein [Pantanalinema sp. GBBB05]|uniref:hypothetical protein n=1 Tax=Pantanalinema sp. GBBB05 TaxID=2604139 RepID=UPI001D46E493|nr:hypothetical protein [Pantanalinema sp. GBBB05]
MSPSPDRSPKSPKSPSPEPTVTTTPDSPTELTPSAAPDSPSTDTGAPVSVDAVDPTDSARSDANAPILQRPPMRPVARPQPPAPPANPSKPAAVHSPAPLKSDAIATPTSSASVSDSPALNEAELQAALRQQPIPPPSEPKQYRAIGLVRGRYTPSEEEFTCGTVVTADNTELKAVLLGRVMSLVRNHLDLTQEHLWVVYPRTREASQELHVQIMGVWEPETLKKSEDESEAADEAEKAPTPSAEPLLEDGFFSIRGEVVFLSPEESHVVVKIQQAPRKSSQKAKAFKLNLQGELPGARTVGYFWDLQVKRQDNALLIADGTCIGLTPPRKKMPGEESDRRGRPPKKFFGGGARSGAPGRVGGSRPPIGSGAPGGAVGSPMPKRRDPASKPVKRTEPSGEE